MITIHKKLLVLCAALALLLPALQAPAQDASSKPMLIVAISSVKELADDVAYLVELAEIPDLAEQIPFLVQQFSTGLDTTKPIGAVVRAKGIGVEVLGFIPVTNFDLALLSIENNLGPAENVGDDVLSFQTPLAPVFLKHSGNFAFIAQTKEQLADLPADPIKMLGGLEKQYDFAIQGNIQAVPPVYLSLAETYLKTGIEAGLLQPLPGETDEQYELRRQLAQTQMDELLKMIDEVDSITIGFSIDRQVKNVHLDFAITAVEGSDLAAESALIQDMETAFSGFLPEDAAISMNVSSKFNKSDAAAAELMLKSVETESLAALDNDPGLDSAQRAALKKALTDSMAVLIDTINGEKLDMAASVSFNGSRMVAIGGIKVVGGKKLDGALQEVLKLAAEEPGAPAIKLNADLHKGVIFHTMSMPLPPGEPEFEKVFGESLEVAVGVGDEGIYFGVGANSLAAVKSAIDNSTEAKIVPSMQFSLSVTKLVKFAASIVPDLPPEGRDILGKIAGMTGDDKISLTVEPIPNGSRLRIQLDEVAIKALGLGGGVFREFTSAGADPFGF